MLDFKNRPSEVCELVAPTGAAVFATTPCRIQRSNGMASAIRVR